MAATEDVLKRADRNFNGATQRLADFLRIPSIGTDPAYDAETRQAGQWLVDTLAGMGFDADLRASEGHPMVVAHHPGPGGDAPHLLYYGHYDVQPADPIGLWHQDPFEPAFVDGPNGKRVVARGAVDDKGQVMTFIEAFRAWLDETGSLPCQVTVFIEGEEESGSPSMRAFLAEHRQELQADTVIVSDTPSWDIDTPSVTTSLRGMLYTELFIYGPNSDLHSGFYGGAVTNPINELTRLLGAMHDSDGRVQIPDFYKDVLPLQDSTRRQWEALGFDANSFLASVDVSAGFGEAGYSVLERIWARPTCDINGIVGGYTGAGGKTVLPAQASAKVSFRLVADQDPQAIYRNFERFIAERLSPGCRYELTQRTGVGAVHTPTDNPYLRAALAAQSEVYGKQAVTVGVGGTIPVVRQFQELLGMDSVLMGFGLADDGPHAPNEKFELTCLQRGIKSHAALLGRLGKTR